MSRFHEVLLGFISAAGKAELISLAQKIEDNNTREVYENALKSSYSSLSLFKEVALKTKNKIDDGLVDIFLGAIREAAAEDGVQL